MEKTSSDRRDARHARSPVAVDADSLMIFRPRSARTGAALTVNEFGRHRIAHRIRNRRLSYYVLVFIDQGVGSFRSEQGPVYALEGPALFWLVPQLAHSYGPAPGCTWSERWAACDGPVLDELFAEGLLDARAPLVRSGGLSTLRRRFDELEAAMKADGRLATATCASLVHSLATQVAELSGQAYESPPSGRVARLIDEVRQRACGEIDFDALAMAHGMSVATLRRRFHRYTGMAPKAFQLHARIESAKQLLIMSEHSMNEIATRVGFADGFYFSRLFSQRTGCSPSEFRRVYERGG